MAFEHDQFARFTSRNGRPSSVVYPQKPPVLARPPRRVTIKMDDTIRRRRRAQIAVLFKLSLLCGWLMHELIANFDESRCFQIASSSSSSSLDFPLLSENATNKKLEENSVENSRRHFFRPIETVAFRMPPNAMGQSSFPFPPSSSPPIVSSHSVGGKERQFHRTTDDAKNSVSKRRRKVILRRKLLRKGATAGDWQQKKKNDGNEKIGAVRRVVWRVVPLQILPPQREVDEQTANDGNAEDGQHNRFNAFPFENEFAAPSTERKINGEGTAEKGPTVRTKTGIVVVRRTDGDSEVGRRRMARQRTTAPASGGESVADTAANEAKLSARFALPFPLQNGRRTLRLPFVFLSDSTVSHQLIVLLNVGFCFFRVVFDFWALFQCFCCALFLLGLYLRRRPLLLVPIAVDVLSIVLAILFALSLVVFLLVLLLLAHSVLPPLSLFGCVLFTASVCVVLSLLIFCVFCEQSAVAEIWGKKRRKGRGEKREKCKMEEKEENGGGK